MKRFAFAMLATAISASAMAAGEAEKPYVGIDFQLGTFEYADGDEAEPSAIRLRAGTEITKYFALEAHAAFGVDDDQLTSDIAGKSVAIELNGLYGVYLRPQLPLGNVASIYGLLGYAYADLSATCSGVLCQESDSQDGFEHDVSFGGGVDVNVYKGTRLSVDYMEYIDGYTAVSAGIRIPL